MLKNIKVYVGKHSKEIQEKAFALGIKWNDGDSEPCEFDAPFLYFNKNKFMTHGNNISVFNSHCYEEITAEEILEMEVPKPKKTIRDLYPLSGFRVMEDGRITEVKNISPHCSYELWNTLPTQEEAEAYKILPMLLHFRDRYNGFWKPNWKNNEEWKYGIRYSGDILYRDESLYNHILFTFKSKEIRDQFLEDFREELEIVKPLL